MATAKKLPSGSWRCLVYVGKDKNGKRKYESCTADTKKEAERLAAVAALRAETEAAAPQLFSAAADHYVSNRAGVLSPWTVSTYRRIIRRDLASLAEIPVASITNARVQAFVSDFALSHSPKTVTSVYGLICAILGEAAPDLRLHVRLPQRRPAELRIPSKEDVQLLIDHADGPLLAAILLASTMGLRRAEICALRWSDVRNDQLRVSRAYAKNEHNSLVLKAPKSTAGTRVLTIPPAALPVLTRPAGADDADPIVPLTPDAITRRFERLCASLGVSYHFHALRHYYASVLLALGVPDKYAMQRMGHATPNMLKQVYQHLISEKQTEIDHQIDVYFSGTK